MADALTQIGINVEYVGPKKQTLTQIGTNVEYVDTFPKKQALTQIGINVEYMLYSGGGSGGSGRNKTSIIFLKKILNHNR